MKNIAIKSTIACLVIASMSSAAFAKDAHGSYHNNARYADRPVASVGINGTEGKQMVSKSTTGHYTVCNQGHHQVTLTHDEAEAPVGAGDCMAVEAKNIKVTGTNDDAVNRINVYDHAGVQRSHDR